jgi:predicted GNAT family N-acyltransferase
MSYVVRFAARSEERDAAYEVRRQVFEVEQNVPRPLDRDAHDFNADHVVAADETGRCIGTGRLVRVDTRTAQIGRMAVLAQYRKQGVGAAMLAALERMAALRGLKELVLASQLPSEPFFKRRGYRREGDVFLDEGVPHVVMRKPVG